MELIGERGFKASETLLGIETTQTYQKIAIAIRFKASETLLGIETHCSYFLARRVLAASKPLKPF